MSFKKNRGASPVVFVFPRVGGRGECEEWSAGLRCFSGSLVFGVLIGAGFDRVPICVNQNLVIISFVGSRFGFKSI